MEAGHHTYVLHDYTDLPGSRVRSQLSLSFLTTFLHLVFVPGEEKGYISLKMFRSFPVSKPRVVFSFHLPSQNPDPLAYSLPKQWASTVQLCPLGSPSKEPKPYVYFSDSSKRGREEGRKAGTHTYLKYSEDNTWSRLHK